MDTLSSKKILRLGLALGILGAGCIWADPVASDEASQDRLSTHWQDDDDHPLRGTLKQEGDESHNWDRDEDQEEDDFDPASEATVAMLSARSEVVRMLLKANRMEEALRELSALARVQNIQQNPEAQEIVSSTFLEGVEALTDKKKWDQALKVANQGLQSAPEGSNLRGFLLMSKGTIYQAKGDVNRAIQAMKAAADYFQKARKHHAKKPQHRRCGW
jgi:tetratricopeptide (TPR) repeat protein